MSKQLLRILCFVFLLAGWQVYASVFGTITAIVHDPEHRPIKGAQVVIQSATSSFSQTATTNDEGLVTVMKLPLGEYTVTVNSSGFSTEQQAAVVTADTVQELHFALQVAARQESVEVTAEPQIVNPPPPPPETKGGKNKLARPPGAAPTISFSMI